jgi:hypothetical protein
VRNDYLRYFAVATFVLGHARRRGRKMRFFGKPKTHKITSTFSYLPIRDPRKKKIKTEDLVPAMPGGKRAGDEFLQKYLYLVRNHMSRELVEEWFQDCAKRKDSYVASVSGDFDEDYFLGYMVQGFAMAVAEFEIFEITKTDQMPDCVWDAMKSFSIQILLDSDTASQRVGLTALLAGYHVARENLESNLKKVASPEQPFTVASTEAPKAKPRQRIEPNSQTIDEVENYSRELGQDPVTGRTINVKSSRFGYYVSDGLTNAALRRGDTRDGISLQRGSELLAGRREWQASAK